MEDLSTVLKGAGLIFFGFFASKIFGYIYSIIIARTLAPSEVGILAIAAGFLGYAIMFANFGIPMGVLRYVPFYKSKGQDEKVKGTLLGGMGVSFVSSIVFAIILFLLSDFIGVGIYNEPVVSNVLKVFALAVPFAALSSLLIIAMQAFKQIKYRVFTRNITESIVKISSFLVLFFVGFRVMAAALALLVSYLVSMLLAFFFVEKKIYSFVRTKVKADYDLKTLVNFSWPLFASTFFALMLTTIDFFMLGYFLDTATVGIYSMAETLSRLILLVSQCLVILFVPIMTSYFAIGKKEEMQVFFKTVTRWIFLFSLPVLIFLILFSAPLLEAFYGVQYVPGFIPLSILSMGFFLAGVVEVKRDMLKVIGQPKYNLINTVASAIVNIALNWTLIPIYGMAGAAFSTAFSYLLWYVLGLVEVYRLTGMQPYSKKYLHPIVAGAILSVPLYFLRFFGPSINSFPFPINIVLLALFSGVFFFAYLFLVVVLGGLSKEDLLVLQKIEAKTGIKINFLRNFIKRFS
jgi:O-antigen/teichoic acid export membrane protein